jgi:error-prone DNA polymerase
LVVWPDVFESQRRIVMGARLMVVHGVIQRDEDVIHVVARKLEDGTHMLRHLSEGLMDPPLAPGDAPGSFAPLPARHPRNVDVIPKSRDFH